jgi:hypothetical protein
VHTLTLGRESWRLKKVNENMLRNFERRVYCPIKENDIWGFITYVMSQTQV